MLSNRLSRRGVDFVTSFIFRSLFQWTTLHHLTVLTTPTVLKHCPILGSMILFFPVWLDTLIQVLLFACLPFPPHLVYFLLLPFTSKISKSFPPLLALIIILSIYSVFFFFFPSWVIKEQALDSGLENWLHVLFSGKPSAINSFWH